MTPVTRACGSVQLLRTSRRYPVLIRRVILAARTMTIGTTSDDRALKTECKVLSKAEVNAILERIARIPIVDTLRMRIDELSDGVCKATVPRELRYDGVFASFHGGLLMTLADSIACFAIMTQTGPDEVMTTTDMNIRFLGPCLSDVTATARVIKLGRTMCPVAVDLFDTQGRQVAVAQVNYMRLDRMPTRNG